MLQANRMVTLYDEAEKAFESGREDANTDEKLVEEYLKYSQVLIQTSQVLALDKPGSYFLRNLLPSFRAMLKREGGKYLDAPIHDWASLSQPDRLDQLICLAGYTKVGRVLLVRHSLAPSAE